MEYYMKQKDYLKFVVDVTSITTKLKLQHEQMIETIASCEEHLSSAEVQLGSIQTALVNMEKTIAPTELSTAAAAQKRHLLTIERELKTSVETPAKHYFKQLAPLKEAFQKIQEQLKSIIGDCEFDLSTAKEQIAQSQTYLGAGEQKLQPIMQKYMDIQRVLRKYIELSSKFMLEQELEETTHKAFGLTKKIAVIEHLLEETPELVAKHEQQFTPLRQALETLTSQTKLLSLAQAVAPEDKAAASPTKAPQVTPL